MLRVYYEDEIGLTFLKCKISEFSEYKAFLRSRKYRYVGVQQICSDTDPLNWSNKEF